MLQIRCISSPMGIGEPAMSSWIGMRCPMAQRCFWVVSQKQKLLRDFVRLLHKHQRHGAQRENSIISPTPSIFSLVELCGTAQSFPQGHFTACRMELKY